MRRALDLFVRSLARVVLTIFFKEVEVVGEDRIPKGVPVILVGNHTNALVDPVLLIGFLPTRPRLLAKSTLWKNMFLRPLLALGGAIPVYRRSDAADMTKNTEVFARCHDELREGGTIALFPEGTSHNEPALLPMKTGAARIVLEAEDKYKNLGVRVVPVGLIFDARTRFRSRALIQVGEPIDPAEQVERYPNERRQAVQQLTDRIGEGLEDVTLNYASWEERRVVERAAEVYAQPDPDIPDRLSLAEKASLYRNVLESYQELKDKEPERVSALYNAVKRYDRLLRVFSLRNEQVASRYPGVLVTWFIVRTLRLLVLRLPLSILGVILNYLPYKIPGFIASRLAHDPDEEATYKVFGGFFLFPLFWVGEALLAGWRLGFWGGLLILIVAPISGYIALKSRDQRDRFLEEARAYLILRTQKRLRAELNARRRAIYDQLTALRQLQVS